jgi:hypothetical protein
MPLGLASFLLAMNILYGVLEGFGGIEPMTDDSWTRHERSHFEYYQA